MDIALWPDEAYPGSYDETADKPVEELVPHLTWFSANDDDSSDDSSDGSEKATVLVIPGGGYAFRADNKAERLAAWLNDCDLHAAVLRYRVSPWRYPAPQFDAIRAMRVLRHRADELNIDPERIVILGLSAGGHLATSVALLHDALPTCVNDVIDHQDPRPDLLGLIYPVISATDHCHQGSWQELLGPAATWQQRSAVSMEKWVDPECPPVFMTHCVDDALVPIANTYRFAIALADAGVDHKITTHSEGGHGWEFDGSESWFRRFQQDFITWLSEYWSDIQ